MAWEDLAIAVIQQALDDALSENTSKFRGHKTPTEKDRDEAIMFLQGHPYYKKTLEYWCECSGVIESSHLIGFAKKIKVKKKQLTFPF